MKCPGHVLQVLKIRGFANSRLAAQALSIKSIQQSALASHADRDEAPGLLALLGKGGRCAQNSERDFHVRVSKFLGVTLALYDYEAPVRRSGSTDLHRFFALLPHELFAHLYEWDRKMFDQVFFSTPIDEVETFWRNINAWNPEWWNVHPLKAEVMLDPTRSQELIND